MNWPISFGRPTFTPSRSSPWQRHESRRSKKTTKKLKRESTCISCWTSVFNKENNHFGVIKANLELLAFALYAVGEQRPEDLTTFLRTLLESDEFSPEKEDPKKLLSPQKRKTPRAG
jgi:hypothetical protein